MLCVHCILQLATELESDRGKKSTLSPPEMRGFV